MADAQEQLVAAVRVFVEDALNDAREARGKGGATVPPVADEFAASVVSLPSAAPVNSAAFDAAMEHNYIRREKGKLLAAGRELNPRCARRDRHRPAAALRRAG